MFTPATPVDCCPLLIAAAADAAVCRCSARSPPRSLATSPTPAPTSPTSLSSASNLATSAARLIPSQTHPNCAFSLS
ncbi:hypothetical protein M427DRAFT_55019, partial [Gonapodya prolifera JEL478]